MIHKPLTLQQAIRNCAIDDVLRSLPEPILTDEFVSLLESLKEIPAVDPSPPPRFESYQKRASDWIEEVFTKDSLFDIPERRQRFLEEANELGQSCGMTREEAHRIVDYVFDREVGDPPQEVGGVVHTLSGFCTGLGLNMVQCAEQELSRVIPLKDKILKKQQAKPKFHV